jgi:hypothetical protein
MANGDSISLTMTTATPRHPGHTVPTPGCACAAQNRAVWWHNGGGLLLATQQHPTTQSRLNSNRSSRLSVNLCLPHRWPRRRQPPHPTLSAVTRSWTAALESGHDRRPTPWGRQTKRRRKRERGEEALGTQICTSSHQASHSPPATVAPPAGGGGATIGRRRRAGLGRAVRGRQP